MIARKLIGLMAVAMLVTACSSGSSPTPTGGGGGGGPSSAPASMPVGSPSGSAGGSASGTTAASGNVMLYTSVPANVINQIKQSFEAANPNLKLQVFRGTTGDVQARIAVEQKSGQIKADVIWVAEPSAYEAYKQQGLLAKYSPPADDPIPDAFKDPDGYYVAARIINMVVAWNTQQIPNGLKDWSDLLDHASKAVFPPPSSGSSLAAIWGIQKNISQDYFQKFKDAGGRQVASNGAAEQGLVSGEFAAAGILDYMVRADKKKGSPVDLAYPTSGTVVIPSPIGITAKAPNPAGAKVLADYLLSKEGQQDVVKYGDFYPVRTDVDPPQGAPSLNDLKRIDVDWKQLVQDTDQINSEWQKLFGS